MKTLTVTLKQHTPLIHFQHDQHGATLRASEVKPKLDRFIITQLGDGDYEEGKKKIDAEHKDWLIGKGDHYALNYKMRIEAKDPRNIAMQKKRAIKKGIEQKDEIGRPLYDTPNYPDNENSLIMGNMGGRLEEEVLNFVLFQNIKLTIRIFSRDSDGLNKKIQDDIFDFFIENGVGNRVSKGFGSFSVKEINGESIQKKPLSDWTISFVINRDKDKIQSSKAYQDIFVIISRAWEGLKKYSGAPKGTKSVFLGRSNNIKDSEERIPAPIIFKPIIDKESDIWKVKIHTLLKENIIEAAKADRDDFYNLIDNAIETKINSEDKLNYEITNIRIR